MASTNKTENFELSQFIGTDKPAWLGDYNADMAKIDSAMQDNKTAAAANATAIAATREVADQNTESIDGLQQAVDDKASQADIDSLNTTVAQHTTDIQENSADIDSLNTTVAQHTTDIQENSADIDSLNTTVAQHTTDIQENSADIDSLMSKFVLSSTSASTGIDSTRFPLTYVNPTVDVRLSQNEDGSVFKLYGKIQFLPTASGARGMEMVAVPGTTGIYGIPIAGLVLNNPPKQAFSIYGATYGSRFNTTFSEASFNRTDRGRVGSVTVGTDGQFYFSSDTSSQYSIIDSVRDVWYFPPCLYFSVNFGDPTGDVTPLVSA